MLPSEVLIYISSILIISNKLNLLADQSYSFLDIAFWFCSPFYTVFCKQNVYTAKPRQIWICKIPVVILLLIFLEYQLKSLHNDDMSVSCFLCCSPILIVISHKMNLLMDESLSWWYVSLKFLYSSSILIIISHKLKGRIFVFSWPRFLILPLAFL